MSQVSSNHPRESRKTPTTSSERPALNKVSRPGWSEIVVGLVVMAAVGFGGGSQLGRLGLDPVDGARRRGLSHNERPMTRTKNARRERERKRAVEMLEAIRLFLDRSH